MAATRTEAVRCGTRRRLTPVRRARQTAAPARQANSTEARHGPRWPTPGYRASAFAGVPGRRRWGWNLTQARTSGVIPMTSQIRLTAAEDQAWAIDVLAA